ncbi:MAG: biotin/lipoyl-binding protein, partial [Rhizobiales bacterium]|nr:biotin/lipoyl-binding protein [Hyphomicrobiales bacterium]
MSAATIDTERLDPVRSIRLHTLVGAAGLLLIIGGVGGWAATTEISGAVIAPGSIVVDSNVKKVQHPTGGVVGELNVRNGSYVHAGDVLVRFDQTMLQANLGIVANGLNELTARAARLESERDGLNSVSMPAEFATRTTDPYVMKVMEGEQRLFEMRRTAREGQKEQLQERIFQLNEEVRGLEAQQAAKGREIDLIQRELSGVSELWDKKLIQLTRLTALEREAARLGGERAQLIASIAQSRGKMAEINLQIRCDGPRHTGHARKSEIGLRAAGVAGEGRDGTLEVIHTVECRAGARADIGREAVPGSEIDIGIEQRRGRLDLGGDVIGGDLRAAIIYRRGVIE